MVDLAGIDQVIAYQPAHMDVAAHCDTFEFRQFAEEILDQMAPFVHLFIDFEGLGPARMLRNDNLGITFVESRDNRVAVERLVPKSAHQN